MNKHNILFISLDTHKEFVEVAYCDEQQGAKNQAVTCGFNVKLFCRFENSSFDIS